MANDFGLQYWNRRVTRRRVLGTGAAGAVGIAAITLVGCSDDKGNGGGGGNGNGDSPTPTVNDGYQDGPAKPGGILRVRQATALPSMSPFGPGIFALAQGLTLGFTVFDHLWYVPTDTGVLELFLANHVEQPDEVTVIATIGDATFHDKGPAPGKKVTAEDVAASYKRFAREPGIGYNYLEDVLDTIEAVDEKTVKITNKFTWAWVFTSSNAGSPLNSSIMPLEVLEGHDDFLRTNAVGSGHWILDGHENGTNIKFRRFPNFRTYQNGRDITGQPYLDGVDFRFITDENAALAAFIDNQTDTGGFTSRKQQQDTKDQLGDKIVIGEDLSRDYFNLMVTYQEPFIDKRVRQAINLCIDREEAMLLLSDGDAKKAGPIPPAQKRYALPEDDPDVQEYFRTDAGEARKLLEAAGWDFNREIDLKHSNRPNDATISQILKEQLGRGGIKVRLVQEDLVKWFSQTLNQGDFQMTAFQHLPYEDPDLPLRFYLSGQEGRTNFMKYSEPKVDDAVLAAAKEMDEEARVEKVFEAQRVIMKEYAPMFNILSQINFGGRYAYVKGSISGRGSMGLFNRTTWLDKA